MTKPVQTAYLAPEGFSGLLVKELAHVTQVLGRLVLTDAPPQTAYWSQNVWYDVQSIPIQSIGSAAKSLRAIQRNWWPYAHQLHRKTKLIQEQLPYIAPKPLDFLGPVPSAPLGSWTLLDETTLLASPHCSSPLPNGEWLFNEDKLAPPSRAYLKLWEFFTRFSAVPGQKDVVLDLGASPGGWTWVLRQLAKKVIAIDKSKLDERAMGPNVSFRAQDVFKLNLAEFPEVSWVFSDVICYPNKLYDFVHKLVTLHPHKKYVFTIKFQGKSGQHEIASLFSTLPGQLVHLSQNKHELTWFKVD